jgi:hypothetical protein
LSSHGGAAAALPARLLEREELRDPRPQRLVAAPLRACERAFLGEAGAQAAELLAALAGEGFLEPPLVGSAGGEGRRFVPVEQGPCEARLLGGGGEGRHDPGPHLQAPQQERARPRFAPRARQERQRGIGRAAAVEEGSAREHERGLPGGKHGKRPAALHDRKGGKLAV